MWLAPSAHMATMDDVECVGARYGRQTSYLMKAGACEPLWWLYHSSKATVRKLEAVACRLEEKAHMRVSAAVAHRSSAHHHVPVTKPSKSLDVHIITVWPRRRRNFPRATKGCTSPRVPTVSTATRNGRCGATLEVVAAGGATLSGEAPLRRRKPAMMLLPAPVLPVACRWRAAGNVTQAAPSVTQPGPPIDRKTPRHINYFRRRRNRPQQALFRDRQLRCEHEMMRWLRQ